MNNPKEKPTIIFQGGPLDSFQPPVHLQVFASDGVDSWSRPNNKIRTLHGTYKAGTIDGGKVVYEWVGV